MSVRNRINEEILYRKLLITIFLIIFLIVAVISSLTIFAPAIGTLFGFISKYRNDQEGRLIKVATPRFNNAPIATKDKRIKLSGYAEPSGTVKLFVNGPEKQSVVADNTGNFTFDNIELIDGKNTITAKSIDQTGESSEISESLYITLDTYKPKITMETPKDKDTIRNLDKRVLIKGSVNEAASVKINDQSAIIKPDLTFELLLGVKEGEFELKIIATDLAGNSQEEKLELKYEYKSEGDE